MIVAGMSWFGKYMSEGVIQTETLQGDVLVALSSDPTARRALLSGCHSMQALPAETLELLASGALATIPSGTQMHMPSWREDREVGAMTISEGKLQGRQVWVCRNQFALLHAWP
jgi:hypothetical protein